jgi:hypothetical protein
MTNNKITYSVKSALDSDVQSTGTYNHVDFEFWKSLSEEDRDFLLDAVEDSRNISIIRAFSDKKDISIPFLGTFKIKPGRVIGIRVKEELLAKAGYAHDRQVDKETVREIKKQADKIVIAAAINRHSLEVTGIHIVGMSKNNDK